ncbi:MAG: hypothetical protein U5L72_17570 [Bacteroidales bacterium]|nr:hypothetical protein [Bacteroidales bacterium]
MEVHLAALPVENAGKAADAGNALTPAEMAAPATAVFLMNLRRVDIGLSLYCRFIPD